MEANMSAPVARPDLSEGMTRGNNLEVSFTTQNYLLNRKPEYYVYLYTVSEQSFTVSRPPLIKQMTIVGKKPGEDWAKVCRIPQPVLEPKTNVDSGEFDIVALDARRLAMDIINPDNVGINQDSAVKGAFSEGQNLGARGLFYSLVSPEEAPNSPVFKQEYEKARKRLEAFYNQILEEAKAVEVSKPGDLHSYLRPEHHSACDYFGIETSWHGKRSRPMDCPNCGARVKSGIAFHRDLDSGTICVIDWKRTIAAGVKTVQDAINAGIPGFEGSKPAQPKSPMAQIPTE